MLKSSDDVDDFLEHFGVKGMKWGVVKDNYNSIRNTPTQTLTLKTSNSKTVIIQENRKSKIAAAIGAASSPERRERMKNYRDFSIFADGKRIGEASLNRESKDEVNLVWLGIKPSERGKGYASSVLDGAIENARSEGYKTISLEVPGNAPDALHIYEKRGFKRGEQLSTEDDDPTWGGLTKMEYVIPQKKGG